MATQQNDTSVTSKHFYIIPNCQVSYHIVIAYLTVWDNIKMLITCGNNLCTHIKNCYCDWTLLCSQL